MQEQGRKLMSMISYVVANLHRLEELVPAIKDLARRHVGYGVKDEHYATVGEAFLDTLAHALGDEFDAELREAWTSAYALMSSVMKIGARDMVETAREHNGPTMLHQVAV